MVGVSCNNMTRTAEGDKATYLSIWGHLQNEKSSGIMGLTLVIHLDL